MIERMIQEFLDGLGARLDPMVAAFLARLLRFFQEQAESLTRLYEAQTRLVGAEVRRVIHEESRRVIIEGFKSIGHGLWQLAMANLIVAVVITLVALVCLFFYGRHLWRKFFWERHMLQEARRQNTLTEQARDASREQRDATLEQNRLLRALLKERGIRLEDDRNPG